jgi:hypothetical protein
MNYIECLDIAAAKLGKDELAIDIKFAFEDKHYELMQTAAELYAHLSNSHKPVVMQAEVSDVSEGAAVGQRSVDTNAEAREIIAECKRRVDCLCGLECKLTIEEVRSSREGHL